MTGERYTLDANVLFYALDADASHKHAVAQQLWRGALIHDCAITLQAMAETYHAISRKRPELAEASHRVLSDLAEFVPVLSADMEVLTEAMRIHRKRHTQFWDRMLWATAKRHGCRTILTEDMQDRGVVDGVSYLNPFRVAASELEPYL